MIKVKVLGTELEADLLNPKVAEKYERRFIQAIDDIKQAKEKYKTGAEGIEAQCNAVIEYIDDVFGRGAAKAVLGEETDLLACLDALGDLAEMYEVQVNPKIKERTSRINKAMMADEG